MVDPMLRDHTFGNVVSLCEEEEETFEGIIEISYVKLRLSWFYFEQFVGR